MDRIGPISSEELFSTSHLSGSPNERSKYENTNFRLSDIALIMQKAEVFKAWDEEVGHAIAMATTSRYFDKGILYCTISSSAVRSRLFFVLENVRRSINRRVEGAPVKKIGIR